MNLRSAAPADLPGIVRLLEQAKLPVADLGGRSPIQFWVADWEGAVVGAVGLERHGDAGLLRSLVVDPVARGTGLGVALVETAEAAARAQGVGRMALLTETARDFFLRRGYAVIARDQAPEALKVSAEFRLLCPASAVCMTKPLSRSTEVLFLCTGNSCRSILGEAIFNHLAPAGWHASSAGSKPTGDVHPKSVALLERKGIATGGCYSKSWDNLPAAPDIVITVCSSAAGEACPAYLGPVLRTDWGVDDPARVKGTDAEVGAAFEKAYQTLRRRIEAFLALPLDELLADRAKLKAEMDRIGVRVE